MKKYFIYASMFLLSLGFVSCNNEDEIDTSHSIFGSDGTEAEEPNEFDKWLLENYVYTYNIQVKYRLDDNETDVEYDLVPADYEKAFALAKIVKFVWMEAYDEVWGIETTRTYVPKLIQMIGNVAYTESGMILGQAEQGMKVTLFKINDLDLNNLDVNTLNEYYFKTMHHEFTHILNQRKPYDTNYDRITESSYVGSDWYQIYDDQALQMGFISPYAMDRGSEDFAEMLSIFVTNTADTWESFLETAEPNPNSPYYNPDVDGRAILEQKFDIVYKYMKDSWGVDLYELRDVVQRRQGEINTLFN